MCFDSLKNTGLGTLARVHVRRGAVDAIVRTGDQKLGIVRCADLARPDDCRALETMLVEGPFSFAALVYERAEKSVFYTEIETYHVSEVSTLMAKFAAEAEAAA